MNICCKVKYCRFSNKHVTKGHKCGLCKNYGHGEIECNNYKSKELLKRYHLERLTNENKCKFGSCENSYYHTTESHTCDQCHGQLHSINTCPKLCDVLEINCPLCKSINILSLTKDKIYSIEDKCKICMDNCVEIILPYCKHACLCIDCSKKISNKKTLDNLKTLSTLTTENYNIEYILSLLKNTPSYFMIREVFDNITFIRRLNNNSDIEAILFHVDQINDFLPNEFVNGYEEIIVSSNRNLYYN